MPESFPFLTIANPTSRNTQSWCSHSGSSNNNSWRPFSHNIVNHYSTPPVGRPPFPSSNHPSRQYLRYTAKSALFKVTIPKGVPPSNYVLFPCLTPTPLLHQIILFHPGNLFFFFPHTSLSFFLTPISLFPIIFLLLFLILHISQSINIVLQFLSLQNFSLLIFVFWIFFIYSFFLTVISFLYIFYFSYFMHSLFIVF